MKQRASKTRGSKTPLDRPAAPPRRRLGWTARIALLALLCLGVGVCASFAVAPGQDVPTYGYEIVNTYPHDRRAFTQGLCFDSGELYEGTGQYGESEVRRVELNSGKVQDRVPLDRRFFGEGIAVWGDRIIQLTWRGGVAIVYDKKTLKPLGTFRYEGEGWGITHDGKHLILSDGSSTLRFLNSKTFKVDRRLDVRMNGRRAGQLNELEYIDGEIWANVWHQDYLLRIDPQSGQVTSRVDLRGLMPRRPHREAVLNGIAYDAEKGRLFVTGKDWPSLFEIKLVGP